MNGNDYTLHLECVIDLWTKNPKFLIIMYASLYMPICMLVSIGSCVILMILNIAVMKISLHYQRLSSETMLMA